MAEQQREAFEAMWIVKPERHPGADTYVDSFINVAWQNFTRGWQAALSHAEDGAQDRRIVSAMAADLGRIAEQLGLDPDDGGAAPILSAIGELQEAAGRSHAEGEEPVASLALDKAGSELFRATVAMQNLEPGLYDLYTHPAPAGEPAEIPEITLADVLAWADGIHGVLVTAYPDRITDKEARVARAIWAAHPDGRPVIDPDGRCPGPQGAATIEQYVEEYEYTDGEGHYYDPSETERAIILDAIHGIPDHLLRPPVAAPDEREIAALREDAERYRWLRDRSHSLEAGQHDTGEHSGVSCYHSVGGVRELKYAEDLDAAIDAARLRAGKEGQP